MSKTQVTSYEDVTLLNSFLTTTPNHLRKVIIHKHCKRRRYKDCKKVPRQLSKANSGNKGNQNSFGPHPSIE